MHMHNAIHRKFPFIYTLHDQPRAQEFTKYIGLPFSLPRAESAGATFLLKRLVLQCRQEVVPVSPAHTVCIFPQLAIWQLFILFTFSISAMRQKPVHSITTKQVPISTNMCRCIPIYSNMFTICTNAVQCFKSCTYQFYQFKVDGFFLSGHE